MNTNDDNFILDLSASCTKDQAVMRLLGWGVLTIYPKKIHLLADGAVKEDSKTVYRPDFSLYEFLSELYRDASNAYYDATPEGSTDEEVQLAVDKLAPKILEVEEMIEKARQIKLDIVDELARGASSELRIDREMSSNRGEEYITIRSLDKWSSDKYPTADTSSNVNSGVDSAADVSEESSIGRLNKSAPKMGKTELGLYTVLGLVTEAYAKELGGIYFSQSEVNIKQVTDAVVDWSQINMPKGKSFPDQSASTVRARLGAAQKCLAHVKRLNGLK